MATKKTATSRRKSAKADLPDTGIETALHTACVKAGAAAALQVSLERLPLLKPFLPRPITHAARGDAPERLQRLLIKEIYSRYRLKPAGWEVEGILAVAQTQSVLTPLATQEGLRSVPPPRLPDRVRSPPVRYPPPRPPLTAPPQAAAAPWAAGPEADRVCRLRKAGADWLPAPLADALNLAPAKLRRWSAEALALALPPLRFATAWGPLAAAKTEIARRTARKKTTKRAPAKRSAQ